MCISYLVRRSVSLIKTFRFNNFQFIFFIIPLKPVCIPYNYQVKRTVPEFWWLSPTGWKYISSCSTKTCDKPCNLLRQGGREYWTAEITGIQRLKLVFLLGGSKTLKNFNYNIIRWFQTIVLKRHIMVIVLIQWTKISCIAYKSLKLWFISPKDLELYAWAKTKFWS